MYQEPACPASGPRLAIFGVQSSPSGGEVNLRHAIVGCAIADVVTMPSFAPAGSSFCLFQCLSGRYLLEADTHDIVLVPGSLYAMGGRTASRVREPWSGSYVLGVVAEPEESFSREQSWKVIPSAAGLRRVELDVAAQSAAFAVARAAGTGELPKSQEKLAARWLESAVRLVAEYNAQGEAEACEHRGAASAEDVAFRKAQRYMSRRFSERLLIEDVARRVGLSSRHLSRIFRAAAGTTPGVWLTELRLGKARAMLESGEAECVKAVAYNCGFSSPSYFAFCYKRHYGVLPSKHHVWRNAK